MYICPIGNLLVFLQNIDINEGSWPTRERKFFLFT